MPARPDRAISLSRVPSVPLFLIPKVIQEQIKKKGTSVFSIFVQRRLHHQYRVRVETFFEHSRRARQDKTQEPESTVQDVLDV
jgi:hypothetical protein